jgi:hypothetical protein
VDALTAALANSAHTIGRQLLRLSACKDVAAPAGDAAPVVPCNWRSAHHRVPSVNVAGGAAAGGAGGDDGVQQQQQQHLLLQPMQASATTQLSTLLDGSPQYRLQGTYSQAF